MLASLDDVDVVILRSQERLSRDLAIWTMCSAAFRKAEVRVETFNGPLDLQSPQGEFFSDLMAVVGKYEKRQRARSAGHFSGACSTTQRHQTWSRSEAEHVVAAYAGHEALLEVERVVLADRAPTRARVSRAGRRVDGLPAPGSPAGGAGSPRRGRPPRRAPRARCAPSAGDLRAAHAGLRCRGRR